MRMLAKILLFSGSTIVGFIVSFPLFMLAWNIQIEQRAFHCTDDTGLGFFFESVDAHRAAGDTLMPEWTWGKIKLIQALYELGCLGLWLGIAAMPALTLDSMPSRQCHSRATSNSLGV